MKKIKKPISILLTVLMVFSVFAVVPFTASAADNNNATTQADVQAVFGNDGTVKLGADITTNGTLTVASGKTVTLDLNGHGIIGTGKYSVITVQNGANLTLKDSAPNVVHKYTIANPTSNGAGLAVVDDANGNTEFTGGFITGGQGTNNLNNVANVFGGGIYVDHGTLNMTAGTIIGNKSHRDEKYNANDYKVAYGGGIYVIGGTLNMTGGAVIGNQSINGYGAGVSIHNDATFEMSGTAKIEKNYATEGGGGLLLYNATFIMNDGFIGGNYANPENNKYSHAGATGIQNNGNGKVIIRGGTIDGTIKKQTDGCSVIYSVASVTDGNTTTDYGNFSDAVTAWNSAGNGAVLKLYADVTTSSTIGVSGTKILDLNGHGIKKTGDGRVISVGSANLTLDDSNPSQTHKFAPPSDGVGLATLNEESGTLTINGGYITGGCNVTYGGGILVGAGSLTMNGGTIIGNQAVAGGGVSIKDGAGTFTLNGGSVSYNEASGLGGGIMSYGSGGRPTYGLLKINGGSVQYNTSPLSAGIFSQTAMELSGSPNISDNKETSGKDSNLTFYGNTFNEAAYKYCIIKVTGELTPVTPIGVTRHTTGEGEGGAWGTPCAGVFTASGNTSLNDASKFKSDDASYIVGKNAAGQLLLGVPRTVTWKDDKDNIIDTTTVANGGVPTHAAPTKPEDAQNTYTFAGWSDGTNFRAPDKLPAVTGDITYKAIFDAMPYVASVTAGGATTKYTDFNAARNAWTEGTTLTLLSDIEMTTGQTQSATEIEGIVVTDTKTLDLNGKTLSLASRVRFNVERVIAVSGGGNLTIKDSSGTNAGKITGASPTADNGRSAGLYINQGSTATMYGGTITGNTTKYGAGVWIDGHVPVGGIFNMHGGVITGNTAEWGGGVYVGYRVDGDGNKGYFNMFGGTITGNTATATETASDNVYNSYYGVTTHTGGTIDGGYEDNRNEYVTVSFDANGGTGTMSDQYVKQNTDTKIKANVNYETDETKIGTKTEPAFTREEYTFAGWNTKQDGTGDNYTAGKSKINISANTTLYANWKPKTLIAGHSLSLDGNIGINFYLDPSVAGLTAQEVNAGNLSYTFAWANGNPGKAKVDVAAQSGSTFVKDGELIKVTCHVCAAEMTCDVNATFKLGDKTQIETYSVRQYCDESVIGDGAEYSDDTNLVKLVNAMLNYGAMAQTKFKVNTGKLANAGVTYNPGDVTTAMLEKAIADANGTGIVADNMNNVAAALGAKWFSTSLIYLDNSTLRHYFVKDTNAFNPSDYTGKKSNYYYYVEVTGIPAAELDNLQTFMESNTEKSFKYSPLDFVKDMIKYSADEDSVNLAKSLYWYNQAANEYFV